MLGKLLKYEFKSTGRLLLPIYLLMIVAALIAGLTLSPTGDTSGTVSGILTLIYTGLVIASIVMTLVITIQRFSNNLLTDEGYLMFTLPVNTANLILSKLITAVCWFIVGTLAGMISAFALSIRMVNYININIIQDIINSLQYITAHDVLLIIQVLVTFLLTYAIFILVIYTSLSVGQLPFAGKHRKGASLGAFFGIYIIYMIISTVFGTIFDGMYYSLSEVTLNFIFIGIELLVTGIMFFATYFILDKHLNLE